MGRKNRRSVRHARVVPGITVNGRPYAVADEQECAICTTGHAPAWREWEDAVHCFAAELPPLPRGFKGQRVSTGWFVDDEAMKALGLRS